MDSRTIEAELFEGGDLGYWLLAFGKFRRNFDEYKELIILLASLQNMSELESGCAYVPTC